MAADGRLGDGLAGGDTGGLLAEAGGRGGLRRDVGSEHLGGHFGYGFSTNWWHARWSQCIL